MRRSTGSTSSWMSSESNYAGHSVMSEGSQASFIVEVLHHIYTDPPIFYTTCLPCSIGTFYISIVKPAKYIRRAERTNPEELTPQLYFIFVLAYFYTHPSSTSKPPLRIHSAWLFYFCPGLFLHSPQQHQHPPLGIHSAWLFYFCPGLFLHSPQQHQQPLTALQQ